MPGSDGPTALFDFGFHPEVLYAQLPQQAVQDDNIFNQSSRNSGYGAALQFWSDQSPTHGPSTGDASPTCSSNMWLKLGQNKHTYYFVTEF